MLEKCGEPTLRDRRTQGEDIRVVEEWYIKVRGHERIFLFENGKLVKIILNP